MELVQIKHSDIWNPLRVWDPFLVYEECIFKNIWFEFLLSVNLVSSLKYHIVFLASVFEYFDGKQSSVSDIMELESKLILYHSFIYFYL